MRRLRANARRIALIACGGAAIVVAGAAWRYPGFAHAGWNYARYASIHEQLGVGRMLAYWLDYIGRMTPDAAGFYTFDDVPAGGPVDAALLAYHQGRFAEAAQALDAEIDASGPTEHTLLWLGMAQLRRGEAQNCLDHLLHGAPAPAAAAEYCVLPFRRTHEDATHARAAARTFRRLLDEHAPGDRLSQWLLNYAAMAAGEFPGAVPPGYRVSQAFLDRFSGATPQRVARRDGVVRFEERAAALGIDTMNAGRGVAVEDFDRDGDLDLVTGGGFDELRYYRNTGGGFEDWTSRGGVAGLRQPFFVSAADYDDDGWPDLVVTRMFHDGFRLLHNRGDGAFEDVTASSGVWDSRPAGAISSAWTPAWADIDLDGDLDLFVAQMGMDIPFARGLLARPRFPSVLLRNDGGRFVDATAAAGLAAVVHDRYFVGAAFGDYDADGDPDLYLSSPVVGDSVLLRNDGGRFVRSEAVDWHGSGFTAAFLDVNHDGRLDLFQAGFSDARSSIEMTMFGEPPSRYTGGRSVLLLQGADGRFTEAAGYFAVAGGTMGASFGDVDNDGCYDFYLGTGSPEGWFIFPNLAFLGVPEGTGCAARTEEVSALNGLASVQKGHGIVFFDADGDGRQDLYSSLGGMWPADRWPNQFFANRSEVSNRWMAFRLRGTRTNRAGLGAVVRIEGTTAEGAPVVRYAHVDQKTGFGSGPYEVHVGMGRAEAISKVEVDWPVSRCRQAYAAALDTSHEFVEGCGRP